MGNTRDRIVTGLLIANVALTVGLGVWLWRAGAAVDPVGRTSAPTFEAVTKYTVYLGTNDKDTLTRKMPLEAIRRWVDDICMKYMDGFTATTAVGGWRNEKGEVIREDTLIYMFARADEARLATFLDEVLAALDQAAILVEREDGMAAWYTGRQACR